MTLREYVPFYKRNLKVAFPVMITQAGQVLVQLADNIMVGHLGAAQLAGVSFANAIIMIGLVFAIGFAQGVTPVVGQHFGKGDGRAVAVALSNSAALNAIMAVVLTGIMLTVGAFMDRMGQDPEVLRYARQYYFIIVAGFIPMIHPHDSLLQCPLLLRGHRQYPQRDVDNDRYEHPQYLPQLGAYLRKVRRARLRSGRSGLVHADFQSTGSNSLPDHPLPGGGVPQVRQAHPAPGGTPAGDAPPAQALPAHIAAEPAGGHGIQLRRHAIMVGWMGKYQLAAHQIAQNLSSLSFMIATGIGAAATIRVSHQFGAGRREDAYHAGIAAVHMAVAIMVFFGLLFISLHRVIPFIYTEDPAVIPIAGRLIIILALYQVFDAVQLASRSSLLGLKDINIPTVFSGISYYVICLPSAYLLGFTFGLGPDGVWIGLLLGLAVAALLFNVRFRRVCRRYITNSRQASPSHLEE